MCSSSCCILQDSRRQGGQHPAAARYALRAAAGASVSSRTHKSSATRGPAAQALLLMCSGGVQAPLLQAPLCSFALQEQKQVCACAVRPYCCYALRLAQPAIAARANSCTNTRPGYHISVLHRQPVCVVKLPKGIRCVDGCCTLHCKQLVSANIMCTPCDVHCVWKSAAGVCAQSRSAQSAEEVLIAPAQVCPMAHRHDSHCFTLKAQILGANSTSMSCWHAVCSEGCSRCVCT